jgi:hypothetical protein
MPVDVGGWLWILIVIGVAALGIAIAYDATRWRRPRNPVLEKIRDGLTARLYDHRRSAA